MTTIIAFNSDAPVRFGWTVVRGDGATMAFRVAAYDELADDNWIGRIKGHGVNQPITVTATLATVDTANDSVRVVLTLTPAISESLLPGVYRLQAKNATTSRTWARGTLTIIQRV